MVGSSWVHPCLGCGACCATFRVSFYNGELDEAFGNVPTAMTEPISPHRAAMCGTNQQNPRCHALEGTIGTQVACTIYARRPSPCREFGASWEAGVAEPRCDEARVRKGLAPLGPADWVQPPAAPPPRAPSPRRRRAL